MSTRLSSLAGSITTHPQTECSFVLFLMERWKLQGALRLGILLAPVVATRFVARNNESNVPASVHHPSRIL